MRVTSRVSRLVPIPVLLLLLFAFSSGFACNFVDISLLISVCFRVSRMKELDYIMIANDRGLSLLIGEIIPFWAGWGGGEGGVVYVWQDKED